MAKEHTNNMETNTQKRDELLTLQSNTFGRCQLILKAKNADYCHGDDPYKNFRSSQILGISPIHGILMRVMDKIERINTFATKGSLEVQNESFVDSCEDIINYMVLIKGFVASELEDSQ